MKIANQKGDIILIAIVLLCVLGAFIYLFIIKEKLSLKYLKDAQKIMRTYEKQGTLMDDKDFETAESKLLMAIRIDSQNKAAYEVLSDMYFANAKMEQAIAFCKKSLDVFPDNAFLYDRLANAYLFVGDRSKAKFAAEQAVKIDGNMLNSHLMLGAILEQEGDWENALRAFKNALALDPFNQNIQQIVQQFEHQTQPLQFNESSMDQSPQNENLMIAFPEGWEMAYEDQKGNMQIVEFLPAGQTLESWKEMITVQIFRGGIPGQDLRAYQADIAGLVTTVCSNAKSYILLEEEENGYPMIFWQQYCPQIHNSDKGEITFFKAIQGNDSFYVVQKAWSTEPFPTGQILLTDDEVAYWAQYLSSVYVCDSRIPERKCSQDW